MDATVSYGAAGGINRAPATNQEPTGRALVAQLADDRFPGGRLLLPRPISGLPAADKRRQFMRVDEGTYENGVFKFIRILERRRNR